MKFRRLIFFGLALFFFSCQKEKVPGDVVIQNVNIIDVKTGELHPSQDVVITGNTISRIIPSGKASLNAKQTVDGSNKYLIPGLWDMHTHTWHNFEHSFPLLLANGITGVRDMFGHIKPCLNLRDQIARGKLVGPDFYFSGPIIESPKGRAFGIKYDQPKNPAEGREIVKKQKREGADFIKVYSALPYDTYEAIAEESRSIDIPLTGHIPNSVKIEEAVNAGQRSIEHLYGLAEHCSSQDSYFFDVLKGIKTDTLLTGKEGHTNRMKFVTDTFDESKIASLVRILKDKNVWICPTLITNKNYLKVPDEEIHTNEKIHFLPDYLTSVWDQRGTDKLERRKEIGYFPILQKYHDLNLKIIKELNENGIKFLAGSDYLNPYCIPGFSLHDELKIFVEETGFSTLQALQTATINPAEYFGKEEEFGSVEEGKTANLLLLSGNPIKDISNSRSIAGVLLRGVYYPSKDLQSKIKTIAQENRLPNIWEHLKPIIDEQGFDDAVKVYKEFHKTKKDQFNFNREQLIDLGYALLDEGKTQVGIKIFEWNTELFPDYWSAFDSLGDGYSFAGEDQEARKAWEQAIKLGSIVTQSKLEPKEDRN